MWISLSVVHSCIKRMVDAQNIMVGLLLRYSVAPKDMHCSRRHMKHFLDVKGGKLQAYRVSQNVELEDHCITYHRKGQTAHDSQSAPFLASDLFYERM